MLNIGDTVKVTHSVEESDERFVGRVGKIMRIVEDATVLPYVVEFEDAAYRMTEGQLEKVQPK